MSHDRRHLLRTVAAVEALVVWLTLWRFLRGVSLQTWLWLLFLAAIVAAIGYAHRHGTLAERERQEAKLAAMIRRGTEAIAEKDRHNAIAQAKAFANGQAIGESRVRDKDDIIAARDRLIADQRAGTVKLRRLWQGCLSGPQAGDAAALSGGPVPEDELRATGAADLVRLNADADSRIARLIEFHDVLRKECEAVVSGP